MKKKLFKKNKLDDFKNNLKKIANEKDKIEQKVNLIIKELKEKIKFINNLKKQFFEKLNMKLKFAQLVLHNYEKKIEDFDVNYYIINNLENQVKFNLLEFKFDKNDSLEKKIENFANYFNKNINSQFNLDNKNEEKIEEKKEIKNPENFLGNDIIDVDYEKVAYFSDKEYLIGILDFNQYLIALYSYLKIFFLSKTNYQAKFIIEGNGINNINACKKIDDEKMLIFTDKNIITIDIRDNKDYIISNHIENTNLSKAIFDFSSKLDLICINYEEEEEDYYPYEEYEEYIIQYFSFPDYNKTKFTLPHNIQGKIKDDKLQFLNDNNFYLFSSNKLESFSIKKNKCCFENKVKINFDCKTVSIIDFNDEFYIIYDKNQILLINKENLVIAKKIEIESYFYGNILGLIKISDKIVSIFAPKWGKFVVNNYDLLSNGIKWELNDSKTVLERKIEKFYRNKNFILVKKEKEVSYKSRKHVYYEDSYIYFLLKIKTKE